MAEPTPYIDYANLPNPTEGFLATLFITVRKVARSRDFYSRVLGGTAVLDENPHAYLTPRATLLTVRTVTPSADARTIHRVPLPPPG